MKIYVQNMVCLCCKMTLAEELNKMGIEYKHLELGEVTLTKPRKKTPCSTPQKAKAPSYKLQKHSHSGDAFVFSGFYFVKRPEEKRGTQKLRSSSK